jgi:Na+-driven multidrug efflux pump
LVHSIPSCGKKNLLLNPTIVSMWGVGGVLGFELCSCLLGKCSAMWAMPLALLLLGFLSLFFLDKVLHYCLGKPRLQPSYPCPPA